MGNEEETKMSSKTKLGLGLISAALGLSLIGGGTLAYFNDTDTQTNYFTTGTLDINVNPKTVVNVDNLKPGDWMARSFKLTNDGSLNIGKVFLSTSYVVTRDGVPVGDDLANEYADDILVEFLYNTGELPYKAVITKSLFQLRNMTPDALANELQVAATPMKVEGFKWPLTDGIEAGQGAIADNFFVKFTFRDTEVPQNELQNLDLVLTWTFDGRQEAGASRIVAMSFCEPRSW